MAKPSGSVVLNTGHALVRNPVSIVPFTEGVGTARDIVTGRGFPVFWTSNTAGNAAAVGFGSPGSSNIPGLAIGVDGIDNLSLPTGVCTIAFVRRKTDATARYSETVSMLPGLGGDQNDPGNQLGPSMIRLINGPNSDNHVYWNYGSVFAVSPAGAYTASTNTEAWVCVAGATALNVYKDSSSTIATAATTAFRTNNPNNQMNVSLNSVTGDNQELNFFSMFATEWSPAEVATWLANPYAFITAGTPPTIALQDPRPIQTTVSPYPYVTVGTAGATTQLGGIYRTCHSGENLQGKLDDMQTGDVLVIDAGASFASTTFTVPVRNTPTAGWCAILSSNDALLPGGPVPGQRVEPIDAPNMPKVKTNNNGGSLTIPGKFAAIPGPSHGWIIRGIEMGPDGTYGLPTIISGVDIGLSSGYPSNPVTDQIHRVIVDRCYIHSFYANMSQNHLRTGILVAGADVRVSGCYITDIQDDGQDTAPIFINNTTGPVLAENNYLAGTGMGLFSGGSYPSAALPQLVNSEGDNYTVHDLVVVRNYMDKLVRWQGNTAFVPPTAQEFNSQYWDGTNWDVKPTLELKETVRGLIEGNTFNNSYNWPAVVFDSWNQGSTEHTSDGSEGASYDTDAHITDIEVRGNRIRKGCQAPFQVYTGNRPIRRVRFSHNLCWGSYILPGKQVLGQSPGNFFYISPHPTTDVCDLVFDHNTCIADRGAGTLGSSSLGPMHRLRVSNNVTGYGHAGVFNEARGTASPAVDERFDTNVGDRVFVNHAMVDFGDAVGGTRAPLYSTANWGPGVGGIADGQYFITGDAATAGISQQTGRLIAGGLLSAGHTYQASDGTDNGVDWRYISNPATRWPTATATPATTSRPAATLIPQGT